MFSEPTKRNIFIWVTLGGSILAAAFIAGFFVVFVGKIIIELSKP